ncbi:MAG: RNA polymerase sigma-54 factor [Omnitrophica bacterium RIFOXYB12_FULL_50_7]|nr:MAG: RNA polymerase sigma-54 factor [Omnitrophica bacterium RIFOXYB12_FULL_50_7]
MSLSPQMRVYLRLLHLPLMDLCHAVEDALEENPMLEEVPRSLELEDTETPAPSAPKDTDDEAGETLPDDWAAKDPLTFANAPADLSRRRPEDTRKIKDFQETLITQPESLFDYLEWQLHFLELSEKQKRIAAEIIGNIDPEGYLKATLEEIATASSTEASVVEEVLLKIQSLDPPGIGARNLREALLIQLERKGPEATLAREIVREHLDLLAKKDWKMLARIFSAGGREIKKAAELIARLDPKPGRSFYAEDAIAITPDATVSIKDGTEDGLEIEIHNDFIPKLRINAEYRHMMREKGLDDKTKEFFKTRLANGMDFLKAIDLRGSTLRTITDEIVRAQPLFFTRGFSHLRPLRLKDIAERVNLHESTISRAIHGKYLKTPQGTIPYKSFFSQKVETENGDGESQKSIMERIRSLVEKEDPRKPLSDLVIAKNLKEEGITLARRTVTKYRETLKILPTHLRKRR